MSTKVYHVMGAFAVIPSVNGVTAEQFLRDNDELGDKVFFPHMENNPNTDSIMCLNKERDVLPIFYQELPRHETIYNSVVEFMNETDSLRMYLNGNGYQVHVKYGLVVYNH